MLLNILHSGGLFWGLTAVFLILEVWFLYQAVKARKSGGITQGNISTGFKPILDDKKTPWLKIHMVWFAIAVLVLYVVALLIVASDYKGV